MHFINNRSLGRRAFIRGAGGASLALPLLEIMLDSHGEALAQGGPMPVHFISWFFGNGVNLARFEPTTVGAGWTPSALLEPLTDVKDHVTVCTGLYNRSQLLMTHHEGLTAFTGYTQIKRDDLDGFASDFGGPTIDQVIADRIATTTQTPFHSLQLQVSKGFSPVDNGSTTKFVSARGTPGSLQPLSPQPNPLRVWEALFGVPPAPASLRMSMLDFVRMDFDNFRPQLGQQDQKRVDAHVDAIRDLERKIQASVQCTAPNAPTEQNMETSPNERLREVNEIMAELAATAFACDLTRVASVLFFPLAGEAVIHELPSPATHHINSHVPNGVDYDLGVQFILDRFGDWMRALQAKSDPTGGTLLDSTLLYASSDCAVGWHHGIKRQPVLIGGHGRGYLKHPGIHYQAIAPGGDVNNPATQAARNTSDVLLTCLQCFDTGATSFGGPVGSPTQSTTPLTDIVA